MKATVKTLVMGVVIGSGVSVQGLVIDDFTYPAQGEYSQTTGYYGSINLSDTFNGFQNDIKRTVQFSGTNGGYYNWWGSSGFGSIGINVSSSTSGIPSRYDGYVDPGMLVMQDTGYQSSNWTLDYQFQASGVDMSASRGLNINFVSAGNSYQATGKTTSTNLSVSPSLVDSTLTLTDVNDRTVKVTKSINAEKSGAYTLSYTGFTGASNFDWTQVKGVNFTFQPNDCANGSLYSIGSIETTPSPTPEPGSMMAMVLGVIGLGAYQLKRRASAHA